MNFQELLQNKKVLYGIIGAVVVVLLIIILGIVFASTGSGSSENGAKSVKEQVIKEPLDLLSTDNLGKAIEIQALLAREGINAQRRMDGSKSTIYIENYKMSERDRALLAIVKSGLMDQNVGLEVFDKGDFTSTKEDKRIRLIRAINGELSRLIRKIPPIENASVFISIPEQSMFTANQKPITATVQITIPSGEKLDKIKVRAITNLILGSVSGITYENISITDTNGNVYSTIENADDNRMTKIEENDKYMQTKVQAQLDRLLGKGNYVVTVSTALREVPVERTSIQYDPAGKAALNEQSFSEGLGDQSRDSSSGANPVSIYIPSGVNSGTSSNTSQNRSYSRVARETQYGVSKTQTNEYIKSGVIEEISIAVTVEEGSIPPTISIDELKQLVADSASPKVKVENVTIAFADSTDPYLASEKPTALPTPDETGNPWWISIVLLIGGLFLGLGFISGIIKNASAKQEEQLRLLREKTQAQEKQILDVNNKALELSQKHENLIRENLKLQQEQQRAIAEAVKNLPAQAQQNQQYEQIEVEDENYNPDDPNTIDPDILVENVKSWIEKE